MSYSPYDQYEQRPKSQGPQPGILSFLLGLAIIAALLFVYAHQSGLIDNPPDNQDEQVIVDPVIDDQPEPDKDSTKPSIDETYIVRIFETAADKDPWLAKQVNNEVFWIKWIADQGMKLHTFDPVDLDGKVNRQAETFVNAAKDQGIEAPFWVHLKRGGVVLSITPFKESVEEDTWKSIIQNSVK